MKNKEELLKMISEENLRKTKNLQDACKTIRDVLIEVIEQCEHISTEKNDNK